MDINIRELNSFCNSWLRKAKLYERYPQGFTLEGARRLNAHETARTGPSRLLRSFDRFTSLYVVFNRVYTEAGKVLIQRGIVNRPRKKYAPLPDRESATLHVVTFYGEDDLRQEISANSKCRQAVDSLVQLIREQRFYLHEDYETGQPDPRRDLRLANEASTYKPKAILSLIYQARCNLFHGGKRFEERQRVLLDNMSIILEFVTLLIWAKLKEELART